jgi:hypothetical protein
MYEFRCLFVNVSLLTVKTFHACFFFLGKIDEIVASLSSMALKTCIHFNVLHSAHPFHMSPQ